MTSWTHPDLGKFTLTESGWQGSCALPSFKVFRYGARGSSKLKIEFETENGSEKAPSKSEIAVAKRVLKNEEKISALIIRALADDLNGRGSDSGMWWHGDTESILKFIEEPLRKKIHLLSESCIPLVLGSPALRIRAQVDDYERPCAVLAFDAAFDPEHGLGILTDGTRVLRTGYQMSVGPFFQYRYHE